MSVMMKHSITFIFIFLHSDEKEYTQIILAVHHNCRKSPIFLAFYYSYPREIINQLSGTEGSGNDMFNRDYNEREEAPDGR